MEQSGSTAAAGAGADGARRSWRLSAGTFLLGCLLGGVLVGVGVGAFDDDDDGDDASSPRAAATADDDGDGAGGAQAGGGTPEQVEGAGTGLYVRVPESCLQTADDATTLVEHVDRVVAAIAGLEPQRLQQTVDQVQAVRDEVLRVSEQCRQEAAQRLEDAAVTEPTPTS